MAGENRAVYEVVGRCQGHKCAALVVVTDEALANMAPDTFRQMMSGCVSGLIHDRFGPDASFDVSWSRTDIPPSSVICGES